MSTSLASAAELIKKIQQEGDNLKNVTSQANTIKKEIAILRDEKELVENQIGIARVELEELGRKADTSVATRKKAESSFAEVREVSNKEIKALNESIVTLVDSIAVVTEEIAVLHKDKSKLLENIEEARKEWANEVECNKKHLHIIKKEGIAEQEAKELLSADVSELRGKKKVAEADLSLAQESLVTLTKSVESLTEQQQKLNKSISEESTKLDAAKLASEALNSDLAQARKELDAVKTETDEKVSAANEKLGVLLTAEQRVERKTERLKEEEKRCRAQNLLRNNFKL